LSSPNIEKGDHGARAPYDHGTEFRIKDQRPEYNFIKCNKHERLSPVLLLPHAIIMFSQSTVTVLVGLLGFVDISFAQSCAMEW
jgi:hypothetical protein